MESILRFTDVVFIGLAFVLNYAGHWTHWYMLPRLDNLPVIYNEKGELHRVPAYIYGVGSILLCLLLWTVTRACLRIESVPIWEPVSFLVCVSASAGLGAIVPRLLKQRHEAIAQEQDKQDEQRVPIKVIPLPDQSQGESELGKHGETVN